MPFRVGASSSSSWVVVWPRCSRDQHGAEKLLPMLMLTAMASAVAYAAYAILGGRVGYWFGGGIAWAGTFWLLRRSESVVIGVRDDSLRVQTREGATLRPRVTVLMLEDVVAVLDGWEDFVFGKVHCWVQCVTVSGDVLTIGPWASRASSGSTESAEVRDWLAGAIGARLSRSLQRGGRSAL